MVLLKDSYRPAGRDSQAEPQDESWQTDHADSRTRARGDSYRPEHRSDGLDKVDSYRPGHDSYHSHLAEQDFYNNRLDDFYRPEQHPRPEFQGDSWRPNYIIRERNTSSQSKPSTSYTSQVDFHKSSFGEPAAPPPSPVIASMDVDMEELLVTTSMLTVANEESSISVVELTREFLLRGFPIEVASLYGSEKARFIPVHKIKRSFAKATIHSVFCKKCGNIQAVGPLRYRIGPRPHVCRGKYDKNFTVNYETGRWYQVLEYLDGRGWKLGPGPGPHDEADSKRYMGSELFDAVSFSSGRRNARNKGDAMQDGPGKATTTNRPETVTLGCKGKEGPKLSKKALTRAQMEEAAKNRAVTAIVNTQLGKKFRPSREQKAQARARALNIVLDQSREQDANNAMIQQALPVFDLGDLRMQLDSLSSATRENQPSILT